MTIKGEGLATTTTTTGSLIRTEPGSPVAEATTCGLALRSAPFRSKSSADLHLDNSKFRR